MPAPLNPHEFPAPHPDWVGARQSNAPNGGALVKIARLWAMIKPVLEPPVATLCRVAHRLVDRNTGIPYSADELEEKILAQVEAGTGGTTDTIGTADGTTDAEPGKLGEYLTVQRIPGEGVAVPDNVTTSVVALTLPPGDWDVTANLCLGLFGSSMTGAVANLSFDPAELPDDAYQAVAFKVGFVATTALISRRFLVEEETTVHLVVRVAFETGNPPVAIGVINARRVR